MRKLILSAGVGSLVLAAAACGGGSSEGNSSATHSAHAKAASAPAATGAAKAKEAAACRHFHADSVRFAANVRSAGTDPSALAAAYGGAAVPVEQDQSGTEGTPLNNAFNNLIKALDRQGENEMAGGNPSNAQVVNAQNALFSICHGVDPSENWTPSG